MIQNIIVYIIVACAIGSVIFRLVKTVRRKDNDSGCCPNCGSRTKRCAGRHD